MKSLENPLEDGAKSEMLPKYSFLLLLAFEGAIKMRNFSNLKPLIQVSYSLVLLRLGRECCEMFVTRV